jgi:acetyl-CoA carboxylase biotin carboxyl carrier protein
MKQVKVVSEIAGSVWKVVAKVGDQIEEEQPLLILESMKMEIPVLAPERGILKTIYVSEGSAVAEGEVLALLET